MVTLTVRESDHADTWVTVDASMAHFSDRGNEAVVSCLSRETWAQNCYEKQEHTCRSEVAGAEDLGKKWNYFVVTAHVQNFRAFEAVAVARHQHAVVVQLNDA